MLLLFSAVYQSVYIPQGAVKLSRFIEKLRRVKLRELLGMWKLPVALVCAPFYRLKHKDLWIICEDAGEARDNGYWLFKYIRQEHKEQDIVYAINLDSPDIDKVRALGRVVKYSSLAHYIMYLASTKKISSQKAGNPNAALFYFLEVYGILKSQRVFLQHGVIKDNLLWLHYDVTKMQRFICGAYPEYQYVDSTYGYPKGHICYTGLCRFDGLHDFKVKDKSILVMPTWREWIADEDYRLAEYEGTTVIEKTNYFVKWLEFLNSPRLKELSDKYGVHFVFYPHRNMQKYMEHFPKSNDYVEILDAKSQDVQKLLKSSAMMITDYSSVFFDMLYMKKPVIYYQFDYEQFRKGQYEEGYFHYDDNPFGKSFRSLDQVFDQLDEIIASDFKVSDAYLEAHKDYFRLYDSDNCKRVYEVVKDL